LYVYVDPQALKAVCRYVFRDLDARYVISIGADDRPYSGNFLISTTLPSTRTVSCGSIITQIPPDDPKVDSISDIIPGANWAEREIRDMIGVEPVGHPYPKRLVLPDGWPDGLHPLRKDMDWNHVPKEYDENREFKFGETPPGCTVVPFGPFHPTLDEPSHFRLYVEGEVVRGCEYRGFMVHRGIEKLCRDRPFLQRHTNDGRTDLRHLRLRPQRRLRPGGRIRRRHPGASPC